MATSRAPESAANTMWWPSSGRSTHAVIDLDAIRGNVRVVAGATSPADVIAIVKANAYGHGAVMIAEAAVHAGATMLAVSTVDEGLELRDAGITADVLVMAPAGAPEYEDAFREGLTLSIAEPAQVDLAIAAAASVGAVGQVQIKVDTGMRRYGAEPDDALTLARRIAAPGPLRLTGVYSHFADADGPDLRFTKEQLARFRAVVAALEMSGIDPGMVHCANTAGIHRVATTGQRAVRLGIGLYGLQPDDSVALLPGMRPALTLRTRVAQVREIGPGDTVSYGRTYSPAGPETVALLPIGYADGLRRGVSNAGWVEIDGQRAPIRGRVCMDQVVVGAPNRSVRVGDPVVVVGDGSDAAPTMSDIARMASTINYEIATGIAQRVPRWYLSDGEPVAVLRRSRLTRL